MNDSTKIIGQPKCTEASKLKHDTNSFDTESGKTRSTSSRGSNDRKTESAGRCSRLGLGSKSSPP